MNWAVTVECRCHLKNSALLERCYRSTRMRSNTHHRIGVRILQTQSVLLFFLVHSVTSWCFVGPSCLYRITKFMVSLRLQTRNFQDDWGSHHVELNYPKVQPTVVQHVERHSQRKRCLDLPRMNAQVSSVEDPNTSSVDKAFQHAAQQLAALLDSSAHQDVQSHQQYNAQQINLELVKRAKRWDILQEQSRIEEQTPTLPLFRYPHSQRIPGCIANVQVRTSLIPCLPTPLTHSDWRYFRVHVQGSADALISKGLLATLISILSSDSVFAHQILDIDPDTVADQLGLRTFLSSGRNDGLASMTRVIQYQIRSLLQQPNPENTTFMHPKHEFQNSNQRTKPTVAMLLSGGVDSSVALHLLLRQNYNVTAFYLKIWLEDELAHLGTCPWEDDFNTCKLVCQHASQTYGCEVPLESISLQKEYKERVISYTIHEAKRGRTPNPDVMCNSRVKFGCFYDAIEGRGFDYVATGHYAMLTSSAASTGDHLNSSNAVMKLVRAPDPVKDQSYFLSALTQDQLRRVLFPVGLYHKTQVRAFAREFDLPNKERPDSQGLCFLGKVKFDEFLEAYLGHDPGDIIDAHTGEIIGRHAGLWFHTVGQRKGLGKVLFPKETSNGPWYVVAKDPEKRLIFASNQYDEEIFTQARSEFEIEDIHWIAGYPPFFMSSGITTEGRFLMKIRHGSTLLAGSLILHAESRNGRILLDGKDKGLAPGQYVAIYSEDGECLGSGVISEQHWAQFFFQRSIHNDSTVP